MPLQPLYHFVLYLLFGKNLLFVHCLASECDIPTNQPLLQATGTISTSQLVLSGVVMFLVCDEIAQARYVLKPLRPLICLKSALALI
ncbi:hypothetical protein FVEG_05421 [Fusarium verticillioides 7600]|uniref:Uncharacterized protein n=1 Tax=Gibberella moniliformis (strain M3125 / FGSC 7600) TaxID=334819 RepID=W7M039_GIBM7|nr:hypothetical protein FVEG_05421 [Fusarium verticillioides 7600]EWG44326.1 hypothetical protein FVEG_05421 [Fusarium verticillioides 7600]